MKIIIESTTKIVHINGVPARVWEGKTESGVSVHGFMTWIAFDSDDPQADTVRAELQEHKPASAVIEAYPLNMFLD